MTTDAPAITAEDIRTLARRERELYLAWDQENDVTPGDDWWLLVDEWARSFVPALMPYAAMAMRKWTAELAEFLNGDKPVPNANFYAARDTASDACLQERPTMPPIPDPAELVAQGLHAGQIARAWKLFTANGDPDIQAVERELAQPGTVLTAEHRAKIEAEWLAQCGWGELAAKALTDLPASTTDTPEPATTPPSLDDLITGGANVAQIARIKSAQYGGTEIEWSAVVGVLATAMRIKLPATAEETTNEAGREVSQGLYPDADLDKNIYESQPTLESVELPEATQPETIEIVDGEPFDDACLRLSNEGASPTAIAKEMGCTPKTVRQAINRAQAAQSNKAA